MSRRTGRGFTLVEAAIATALVGGLLAAALHVVGVLGATRRWQSDRVLAHHLALSLLHEIVAQPYGEDADGAGLGPGSVEAAAGTRLLFDDVDDYDGLSESPPATKAGVALGGYSGWTRSADVHFVRSNNPSQINGSETGLKRITVVVSRGGRELARLTALRAEALDEILAREESLTEADPGGVILTPIN